MRYLIDTNAVIGLMNGRAPGIAAALARQEPGDVGISAVVLFELAFGAFKSSRVQQNLDLIGALEFPHVPFEAEDAVEAGRLRDTLRRAGRPIGEYDLLIAGQALARGLVVVTANMREFERVVGLRVENWGTTPERGQ